MFQNSYNKRRVRDIVVDSELGDRPHGGQRLGTGPSASQGVPKQAQVAEPRSLIFTSHFTVQSNHQPSTVAIATVISHLQVRKPKKQDNRSLDPQRNALRFV